MSYAIVNCDGHAALYLDGKKINEGSSGQIEQELLEALGVTTLYLDDDALEEFPEQLSEVLP